MADRFLPKKNINKIRQEFKDDSIRVGYVTMNCTESHWEEYKKEIEKQDEINFVDIEHPIYFKVTDKQYIFDPNNPNKLRKHLEHGFNELLKGADALIDAMNDLDIKCANTDNERLFVERKIKLRELMLKSGKLD
jgi:hypothetical protein